MDTLSAQKELLTSSHNANASSGMEVLYGHRKQIIQRHTSYLQMQDGHGKAIVENEGQS